MWLVGVLVMKEETKLLLVMGVILGLVFSVVAYAAFSWHGSITWETQGFTVWDSATGGRESNRTESARYTERWLRKS